MAFVGDLVGGVGDMLFGSSGGGGQAFRAPGYQQQGQLLNQLFTSNLVNANPSLRSYAQSLNPNQSYSLTSQPQNTLNFGTYSPYQFTASSFDPTTAVGDAFTPQATAIENILNTRATNQIDNFNNDINKRGLFSSGAALEGVRKINQETGDQLTNALLNLSGQQASQQLGANQFAAQLEAQRQQNQAAEIFRNQGASDQQAIALANYATQQQRQPIDDLMRLFALSTGQDAAYQGSPGLLQAIAPTATAGLFGAFCLPKETKIETEHGTVNVEDVKVGDTVKGGKVIAKTQYVRGSSHKFSLHKFDTGEVVMTYGHPYFDKLISVQEVESESECTYDILTDSGFYFVNNVKLGSTINGH